MSDFEKRASAITLAGMRVTAKDQFIGDMLKYLELHQKEIASDLDEEFSDYDNYLLACYSDVEKQRLELGGSLNGNPYCVIPDLP